MPPSIALRLGMGDTLSKELQMKFHTIRERGDDREAHVATCFYFFKWDSSLILHLRRPAMELGKITRMIVTTLVARAEWPLYAEYLTFFV